MESTINHFTQIGFDEFIDEWLNNDQRRLLVGKNAREAILKNHTWKTRIDKILKDLK